MIETNNRGVNVSDLMERVRAKAREFRGLEARTELPAVLDVQPVATAILPGPVVPKTEQILQATQNARRATRVSRWVPKLLRGLFRRQGKFNDEIIRALEQVTQTNAQLAERLRHLAACVEVQDHGIQHLAQLRRSDAEWMTAVVQSFQRLPRQFALREQVRSIEQKTVTFGKQLDAVAGDLRTRTSRLAEQIDQISRDGQDLFGQAQQIREKNEEFAATLAQFQSSLDDLQVGASDRQQQLREHGRHLNNLQAHAEQHAEHLSNLQAETRALSESVGGIQAEYGQHLKNLQSGAEQLAKHLSNLEAETRTGITNIRSQHEDFNARAEQAGRHLNNLQTQADSQGTHLHNLQLEADQLRTDVRQSEAEVAATVTRLEEIKQALVRGDERHIADGAFLKSELNLLGRRILDLSRAPSSRAKAPSVPPAEIDHQLDALYVAFEDQFRGSRELIKKRLNVYLPDIATVKVITKKSPLLDLGCGRGEWLELLQSNDFACEGVDSNTVFAGLCQQRGLQVTETDAIAYLRSLPPTSRGAVTAFHLIEHLPFPVLVDLVKESLRVLKPGGLVIFETPNPDNLLVGSSRFYSDPTHLHPLPKEYPAFLLRSVGFSDVATRPLNPDSDSLPQDCASPELRNFLNQLFFGEQDYAVIGRKPAG